MFHVKQDLEAILYGVSHMQRSTSLKDEPYARTKESNKSLNLFHVKRDMESILFEIES